MAQILKFEAGKPEILALKFDAGKLVEGKFGDQFQYSTVDGRVFWLDHEPAHDIEDQIRRLGIRTGEEFRLGKQKTSHGSCRWTVERVAGLGNGYSDARPARDAASAYRHAPAAAVGETTPREAQSRNGNHATPPAPPAPTWDELNAPAPPAPERSASLATSTACMASAMCSAVDAAIETQAYATRKGLGLTFSEESIRCIGLSIYISACKGGR